MNSVEHWDSVNETTVRPTLYTEERRRVTDIVTSPPVYQGLPPGVVG